MGTGRPNRKEAGGGSDRLVNNKTELLGKKNTDPNRGFQGDVGLKKKKKQNNRNNDES